MKNIRYIMFTIITLALSFNVSAAEPDTFFGFYNVNTKTSSNTAGTISDKRVFVTFGQGYGEKLGVGWDVFYNETGLGGSLSTFYKIKSKYKVSLGVMSVPDLAYREPVATWPVDSSRSSGAGAFIGFEMPIKDNLNMGIRYTVFDVGHTFSSDKCTANCATPATAVYTPASGTGSAKRDQIWIGITYHI